ncbi:aminotransferase DegT [Candidatus Woesearchaeota archaeon CG10_big_fil_rev_8_21_14_0_10_45_16]|nr:MAG: aminotransferase DegT [Candidatus Woesearchaeota archaeon CG10_big_fil_rev_8_21_14_0_10_45_16]
MIPIAKPILGKEEKEAVLAVLDSGMLAQGKKVQEFEESFARFIGTKHAIATTNGTTALHAALQALGIKEGDEVITSPFTFAATGNTIRMVGATPVFVDIDPATFNIDSRLLEKAITPMTKAIMPVHLFGKTAEMGKICEIAKKHGLSIIEDACQAHGAAIEGKKAGSFGTACFSFYATKNMTTGEGGMVTTDDDDVAAAVRKFINHGSWKRYHHDSVGHNFRMTDLAAAIGCEQLRKIGQFNAKRRENAAFLTKNLKEVAGLVVPEVSEEHVYHQYTLRITDRFPCSRDEVSSLLTEKGIGNATFYPVPLHQQQSFAEYNSLSFPEAEKAAREVLSIPVHPEVTQQQLQQIVAVLRSIR